MTDVEQRKQYLGLLNKRVSFKYDEDEPKPFYWTGKVKEVLSDHLIIFEEYGKQDKAIYFNRIITFVILEDPITNGGSE